jgi:hypothetical protein
LTYVALLDILSDKVNKKLAEQQGELPQDQVDLQQFMAPTPLPPAATPQQFIPPPIPQQPLLQSEVPDMVSLDAEALDPAQLAGMVPTTTPASVPLLAPPTPGVPPPTPGLPPPTPCLPPTTLGLLPPATPMPSTPLPMDVEMPQIPPEQVDSICDPTVLIFFIMEGYFLIIHNLVQLPCPYDIFIPSHFLYLTQNH